MSRATPLDTLFTSVRWGHVDTIIFVYNTSSARKRISDLLLRSMKVCCNFTVNYKAKLELHCIETSADG